MSFPSCRSLLLPFGEDVERERANESEDMDRLYEPKGYSSVRGAIPLELSRGPVEFLAIVTDALITGTIPRKAVTTEPVLSPLDKQIQARNTATY
jgi:hypothetical protein